MYLAIWMVHRLKRDINRLERQAMEKTIKLSNHQKYASRLGGAKRFGVSQIAGLSSELVGRASIFSQYAEQASSMSAMHNLQQLKMMGRVPITGNPMTQYQIEMSSLARFKEESMKALKQREVQYMNELEAEIEQELTSIENQLSMKRAQLKEYQELAKERIQDAAPKFGLS